MFSFEIDELVHDLPDLIGLGLPDLFRVLDLTGVFVNGLLGGLIARKQRFDAMGFAVLAIISALGGGILRDIMLQQGPPVALLDPAYLTAALCGAAGAFLARFDRRWWNRGFIIADALVLGCWAATGAAKALNAQLGWMAALMLGTITAVGGSTVRDIAVGKVPAIFGGTTLYGTAAIAGAGVMVVMYPYFTANLAMLAATFVSFVLCILARWRRWMLPEHSDWTITLSASEVRRLVRAARILPGRPKGRQVHTWIDNREDEPPAAEE
ncbi:MAG: trimeric intracellular cation channel family protein [Bowdeniella nasicola]|nr:trimeric intracellular cation channel family protein [Bowdeniella nasicola]